MAELIYGDKAENHFDEAVRIVILILIFVFDPLAVLLLIAANISLKQWRTKKTLKKDIHNEDLKKKIERLQKKNELYKTKQGVLLKSIFGENADQKSLAELNPDEIKVKLDQILEIKDEKNT